jgi:hypothetical protein
LLGILSFFPASHRGSILITSRHAGAKGLGQSIELDRMEKKEGLWLLLRSSVEDTDELDAAEHSLVSECLRMRLDKVATHLLNTAISHLKCYLDSIRHIDYQTRQEGQAHLDTIWRGVEDFDMGDHFLEAREAFGKFYRVHGRWYSSIVPFRGDGWFLVYSMW